MIKIQELSKRKLAELDDKFDEFQDVDKMIARREFEIRYPWKETDQNIGGGKSSTNADSEQRLLEAIEADKRITYLRHLQTSCEAVVSRLTKTQAEVYKTRYQSRPHVQWADVPDIVHMSRSSVYYCRYAILECLAQELGWLP